MLHNLFPKDKRRFELQQPMVVVSDESPLYIHICILYIVYKITRTKGDSNSGNLRLQRVTNLHYIMHIYIHCFRNNIIRTKGDSNSHGFIPR